MPIKYINPADLKLPRVYFTEFDRITYSQVAWTADDVAGIKRNLERKVKLLSLIKGVVIIAASHLFESELAREFITENPIVLKEGIVLPALNCKYNNFDDFLTAKREGAKERKLYSGVYQDGINKMLSEYSDSVVRWDVNLTVNWFKERLLKDMEDNRSVLRTNLSTVPFQVISEASLRIADLESPSRVDVYKIAKESGDDTLWTRLSSYADFVYYLSGARAVNSEGVLPQENLIDFSISDMTNGKTKLSDYEIFYRIFTRIIQDNTQKFFPVEVLDLLSFEDIVELRNTLFHSSFVEKYNNLMEKTKQRIEITDTEQLILNINELSNFEHELCSIFTDTVVSEINQMKKIDLRKKGLTVLTSIGAVVSFYGTIESIIQLTVNVLSILGLGSCIHKTGKRIEHALWKTRKFVDGSSFDNKPLLLRFISEIDHRYSSKLI